MTTSVESYRKQFQKKRAVKIKSLTEYFNAITALDSKRVFYRGQADSSWEIQSSAYRHIEKESGQTPTINALYKYHEKLIRDIYNLNDCEELKGAAMLAELQHKGGKTWLIDYTVNPLVALWFATNPQIDNAPGCVYCIENKAPISDLIQVEDSLSLQTIFEDTGIIHIFNPPNLNRRIISQQSVFLVTAQGHINKERHYRIEIPSNSKENIRSQLALMGISRKTLFPDFHGFIEWFNYDPDSIYDELMRMLMSGRQHLNKYRLQSAEEMYNNAYDLYHTFNLPDTKEFADILAEIHAGRAKIHGEQFKHVKALKSYRKALNIRKRKHGKAHLDVATTYEDIAEVYYKQGNYAKALNWNQKALNIREKLLGKEHLDTANSYNNMAVAYNNQGNYDRAMELHQRALDIFKKVLSREHPDIATSYNNIGVVYDYKGDYDSAMECYQKALGIFEKSLGKEHPNTANSYHNIATIHNSQGDYDSAMEWYQKALNIREKVLGKEHPNTATSYNNIAEVHNSQSDYAKAMEWHQMALGIFEKSLGKEHPNTANSYHNIAAVYGKQGDYNRAMEWHQKALAVFENRLGTEHPRTISVRKSVESLKKLLKNRENVY